MQEFLDHASKMYYKGTPIISDAEFDCLSAHFNYLSVGHTVTDGIPHYYPMYSLQKVFDIKDAPFALNGVVESPKLDGAAVSLLYVDGNLVLGLTRGDGKLGRDITEKMKLLAPNTISLEGIRQITGEVVAPSFIANSRNYASGALNLKDLSDFAKKDLTFVAYDMQRSFFITWTDTMHALEAEGFHVINNFDWAGVYPTDGVVYRIDDIEQYGSMGFTSHHPRGSFALKEQKEGVVTKLLNVEWQVGKSGVVSPVAILEPVKIGDAVVAKATLHNIEYIRALDLELGCEVEVIRSGEIIPRIVRRIS
jgi:NAD-dependent DNA ligase